MKFLLLFVYNTQGVNVLESEKLIEEDISIYRELEDIVFALKKLKKKILM